MYVELTNRSYSADSRAISASPRSGNTRIVHLARSSPSRAASSSRSTSLWPSRSTSTPSADSTWAIIPECRSPPPMECQKRL
jgi:hypothetical protein